METKKYYEAVKDSLSNDDKVQAVVMQVLAKGLSTAFFIFVMEFACKTVVTLLWAWRESNKKGSSISQDCSRQWDPMTMLVTPSIISFVYVGELLATGNSRKAATERILAQSQFMF